MMQGAGRNMQAAFLTYVQTVVVTGLMLSGMSFGMADDSVAPDVLPESTQIEPVQTNISSPKAAKPVAKAFNMDMVKGYNKRMVRYSLQELRARFDGLVLKVLALLGDDPGLSRDINLAREEIWKSLLTTTQIKPHAAARRAVSPQGAPVLA